MKLKLLVSIILAVLLIMGNVEALEFDENELEDLANTVKSAVPESAKDYFDKSDFSTFTEEPDAEENSGILDFSFLARSIKKAVKSVSTDILNNILMLTAFVIVSILYSMVFDTVLNDSVKKAFNMVLMLCLVSICYGIMKDLFKSLESVLNIVGGFANGMLPAMTMLYNYSGSISTSVLNSSAMSFALNLLELLCNYILYPILNICFGFGIVSGFANEINLKSLSKFIRNTAVIILSIIATLFSALLCYNNEITQSADGMALRTVKFAASGIIPIVGGAVSEAAKTLGGSLSYIKSTVGVLAIAVIFVIVLPCFVRLLLYRLGFSFVKSVSELCINNEITDFISEMGGLLDFCIALCAISSTMFVIIFTLLIKASNVFAY